MKAFLILENGTVYQGIHIGAVKEVICEIVFNTSMAGYVEALTDPAAAGQAVCMTYPLVGNYGVCIEDSESGRAWGDGLIVRELSRIAAIFRTDLTIQGYLQEQGIFGITGIDTRSLTKLLRINGTMSGCLTTNEHFDLNEYLTRIKAWRLTDAVAKVTTAARYENKGMRSSEEIAAVAAKPGSVRFNNADYSEGRRENSPIAIGNLTGRGKRVAVLDTGIMNSQLEALTRRGCDVTVFPAGTPAEELLAAT
ncbi:MAG: carbamoyl phosphate synthase small subunit, partial [Lachnospiraceae bacterium]|nr:carbamoyl phosphate synthase small subunit [Lachnospiraceae bacterium]